MPGCFIILRLLLVPSELELDVDQCFHLQKMRANRQLTGLSGTSWLSGVLSRQSITRWGSKPDSMHFCKRSFTVCTVVSIKPLHWIHNHNQTLCNWKSADKYSVPLSASSLQQISCSSKTDFRCGMISVDDWSPQETCCNGKLLMSYHHCPDRRRYQSLKYAMASEAHGETGRVLNIQLLVMLTWVTTLN